MLALDGKKAHEATSYEATEVQNKENGNERTGDLQSADAARVDGTAAGTHVAEPERLQQLQVTGIAARVDGTAAGTYVAETEELHVTGAASCGRCAAVFERRKKGARTCAFVRSNGERPFLWSCAMLLLCSVDHFTCMHACLSTSQRACWSTCALCVYALRLYITHTFAFVQRVAIFLKGSGYGAATFGKLVRTGFQKPLTVQSLSGQHTHSPPSARSTHPLPALIPPFVFPFAPLLHPHPTAAFLSHALT